MAREVICNIGEVKLGRGTDVLRATLGSCVGIGVMWRRKKRCVLAHCLLADGSTDKFQISAKYVTQAIPSILALLKASKEACGELEAVVVGGAQMLGPDSSEGTRSIGKSNAETAVALLKKLGIKIVYLEVGGEAGRQISIDCESYEYHVRSIRRDAA